MFGTFQTHSGDVAGAQVFSQSLTVSLELERGAMRPLGGRMQTHLEKKALMRWMAPPSHAVGGSFKR